MDFQSFVFLENIHRVLLKHGWREDIQDTERGRGNETDDNQLVALEHLLWYRIRGNNHKNKHYGVF